MFKHVVRAGAVALGTVLSLSALAAPAAAEDVVPEGCFGSLYYACTGNAEPPSAYWDNREIYRQEVRLWSPGVALLPGQTVGGQQVGGVAVTVGGELSPEQSVTVGGPIGPVSTGIIAPVNACAFVTCIIAGEPIVIPGQDLPIVPVVIPAVEAPATTVDVPVLATLPQETVDPVGIPAFDVEVTTLRIYESRDDSWTVGDTVCSLGGGEMYFDYVADRSACRNGSLDVLANYFFERAKP